MYTYLQRILQTEFKNSDFIVYMKKDLLTGRFEFLCHFLCLCVIWNGGDEVGGVSGGVTSLMRKRICMTATSGPWLQ